MVAGLLQVICICIQTAMASNSLLDNAGVRDMAQANTELTLDLMRRLGSGEFKGQNMFLGPFSVTTALSMTLMGARGDTAKEMSEALHLPSLQPPVTGEAYCTPLDENLSQYQAWELSAFSLKSAKTKKISAWKKKKNLQHENYVECL